MSFTLPSRCSSLGLRVVPLSKGLSLPGGDTSSKVKIKPQSLQKPMHPNSEPATGAQCETTGQGNRRYIGSWNSVLQTTISTFITPSPLTRGISTSKRQGSVRGNLSSRLSRHWAPPHLCRYGNFHDSRQVWVVTPASPEQSCKPADALCPYRLDALCPYRTMLRK